jgi:hypothetical protein
MWQRITSYRVQKQLQWQRLFLSHFLSLTEFNGCVKAKNKIVFARVIIFESRAYFKLAVLSSAPIKSAALPRVICAAEQWTLLQKYNCKAPFVYCCMFLAMLRHNLSCWTNGAVKLHTLKISCFDDRASRYMRVMKPTRCTIYLQFIQSLYLPLHVSGLLVAHHQEVTMYICNNWYVL